MAQQKEPTIKENAELLKKIVENFELKQRGDYRELAKRLIRHAGKNIKRGRYA